MQAICPICGAGPGEVFASAHVQVAKCGSRDCGHLWACDTPAGRGVQFVNDPNAQVAQYEARDDDLARLFQSRGYLRSGVRLLDVGAGAGHLLECLNRRVAGLDITAVEVDPASLARLRALGFTAYASLDGVHGSFDAINLIEVIEHLDDPVAVMTALRPKLRSGGRLFCTTPCGETRRGDRKTNAYETSEHVQFFTEKSLALCFEKAGFSGFVCETIGQMTSKLTPPPGRYIKDLLRPARAALFGHRHLTGFASA